VGGGNFGMATKGSGGGGGGEGEGTIHGTGNLNVGGAGSANRKKSVKGNKRPQEKKVAVRTGTPTIKGQLSKELIDREVRRHRAQVTFCYNKQLLRHPNLSGKVLLRWIISMDGSVKGAKIKSSSLGNKDAESCMVRALESWRFPKPEGGVVQVDYPFIFGTK
jgi:TonB family protein